MISELLLVLLGGLLALLGGLAGAHHQYRLDQRREQRQQAEALIESARRRMYGDRVSKAEIQAWVADAGKRGVAVSLNRANLTGAYLDGLDLSEADLGEAVLRDADLRRTELRGADLGAADLWGADLSGANLQRANLRGARVTDEQLAQAKNLEGATLPNGTVHE